MPMPDASVIRDAVRRHDPNRYAAALLAPPEAREHLFALYAFNIELTRISAQVREPHLGEIRLQWWRDALGGETGGHPVAAAIAATHNACGLPDAALHGMIDARSFDVAREPMPDMAALRRYLEATVGAVFALAARVTGQPDDAASAAELASHAGVAYGLAGLLRALPLHAARGQVFLPCDVLAAHGASAHDITGGRDSAELRAALAALCRDTVAELDACRPLYASIPDSLRHAFLPLALVAPTLRATDSLRRHNLRELATISPFVRFWKLWRAYRRGTF